MSVLIPSLTASLPGARPQPPQASAPAAATTQAASRTHTIAPAALWLQSPAWPEPGTVNLPTALIGLSETQIPHTATTTLPETAPDFWDLLATALPGEG
ncbi:hypothetical protein [Hoeflea sp.]|uniref:hypothetical protein n=1 Tax=Hoeflea sp. TaxID=1940281 RepID=UPI003749EAA5